MRAQGEGERGEEQEGREVRRRALAQQRGQRDAAEAAHVLREHERPLQPTEALAVAVGLVRVRVRVKD